jgi:thiazole/oxazole-forming peptide maturase SagD family component
VPMPFDESAEIEWTPLWSLTQETFCYLPTGYLYYSYPGRSDQAYFLPNSNGNAAGTSIEDAILQGFLELVERDAVAVWWYNRLRRPAVDLDSFDDPFVRDLAGAYRSDKRDLWVLDVTNDLGIPAFVAVARRVDQPIEDIIFAPAAHLDPRIALTRALTELNQMLPGVSTTDGSYSYHDPAAIEWWQTATIANQPWLKPAEDVATRRRNDFPFNPTPDLREDVELCRSIVERQGLEMLVLDQTRPDIGVPVVKVVVPGLRHFWARFAPGRLYDVPVKVGWLDKPTQEADLNPIEVFI